jgi:hypothetical protein
MIATVMVGIFVIATSLMYAGYRQDSYEEKMQPYDAAMDLVEQVNENEYLRGVDFQGDDYEYIVLSKDALEWYVDHRGKFEGNITSEYNYRITFDDLNISDDMHYPTLNLSSYYVFGSVPSRGTSTVSLTVHYALDLLKLQVPGHIAEESRHICTMKVEVWE